MPRKTKTAVEPQPCADCDGTGETQQPITRRRGTVRGQMGVCLTCLGTGTGLVSSVTSTARPHL